ncbi:MAG: hypothetical protein JWN41_405 [Thermoleophilia bacterium]|nr:hypothetical protein [Thermoleophilia bacterium]
MIIAGLVAVAAVGGTGFGASKVTLVPTAAIIGTLSMTSPTALSSSLSPVCTKAVATLDTDACSDVSFAAGPPLSLSLGTLSGADVQAGTLTWKVSTTNPAGYVVHVLNPGPAPFIHGAGGGIPDMSAAPIPASAVDKATHAGIAVGDPTTDGEASVSFAGSPWVTASGQQGELFRGVPTAGLVVAQRTTPQLDDPVTITIAAASVPSSLPPAGGLDATLSVIASAL